MQSSLISKIQKANLYAREPEIYQVVASAHATKFATMAPELLEWVSSFETTP